MKKKRTEKEDVVVDEMRVDCKYVRVPRPEGELPSCGMRCGFSHRCPMNKRDFTIPCLAYETAIKRGQKLKMVDYKIIGIYEVVE